MVTLSDAVTWNSDQLNWASFCGGVLATVVVILITWYAWRVFIRDAIDRHRARKVLQHEQRVEFMREQIRSEVMAALGGDQPDDAVWYSEDALDDPLCFKNGWMCERAAGHSGECTPVQSD